MHGLALQFQNQSNGDFTHDETLRRLRPITFVEAQRTCETDNAYKSL